ncbi:MAG: hypothetical protein FJY56_01420 [Betaproteobacteria bacterium]|nr:hypothetical protein [Betaproteobacteria bacterium]
MSVAQTVKAPVELKHSGSDNVGQRLAFELREVIRGSHSMRLVSGREADPRIVVQMVSLEASRSSQGAGTVVAVAITYDGTLIEANGLFLTSVVQNCGSSRVQECARDLAADVDQEIEKLKKNWPNLARALR